MSAAPYADGREWSMGLIVRCRVETCPETDEATVADCSAHGATEGVKRLFRYRGWTLGRRDNLCPEHSGPIPACEACGDPTPKPYGVKDGKHITGKAWTCLPCYRDAMDARVRERQAARITEAIR